MSLRGLALSAPVVVGLSLGLTWSLRAQGTAGSLTAVVDPMQEVTPEREAAAETFAKLHHPELAALLGRLRESGGHTYDNAVRDLFRESERLAKLKGRDPERYAIELEIWKTGSRIQLAAARLAMEDSPSLKAELHALLEAKLAIRRQLLQLDRDKTAVRLQKLDAELAALKADPAEQAEQELEKLLKAARPRAAQAAQKKPNTTSKPKSDEKPATPSRGRGGAGGSSETTEKPTGESAPEAVAPSSR